DLKTLVDIPEAIEIEAQLIVEQGRLDPALEARNLFRRESRVGCGAERRDAAADREAARLIAGAVAAIERDIPRRLPRQRGFGRSIVEDLVRLRQRGLGEGRP